MKIIYEIEENVSRVSLFGEDFVKHNKSRCYLLIDGQKMELCKYLISLPDISNWDTKNINNMNGMFYNCRSLSSLSGISEWDVQNVTI